MNQETANKYGATFSPAGSGEGTVPATSSAPSIADQLSQKYAGRVDNSSLRKGRISTDQSAALLGMTAAAQERRLAQAEQASQEAMAVSERANSAGGLAAETLKGIPNAALGGTAKFIGSTIASPIDLVKSIFGKGGSLGLNNPLFGSKPTELPALKKEGMTTYQQDAEGITGEVFDGTKSPLMGTVEAVGNPLLGALDTTGVGVGAGKLIANAPKVAGVIGKEIGAFAKVAKTGVGELRHPFRGAEGNKMIKTIEHLKSDADTMTKGERISAEEAGRLKMTKTGKTEFDPSDTEVRASQILTGKTKGNPVKDLVTVKEEISTRGKEAETYLKANSKAISNKEDFEAFDKVRQDAAKYLTDTEMKAYDEQVKMFSKQLQGRGGYNTENYYRALKDYEANVADKLPRGKERLLDPTGIANAKIRAASDVRKVVRDMIATKNSEFKPKMFDLASLYDVKGTLLEKADQIEGNFLSRFIKKHPVLTGLGSGLVGGGIIRKAGGNSGE